MNTHEAKRVLETALICAQQPLPVRDMRALFADEIGADTIRDLLDDLVRDWQGRGVELVALASGWRFQSRPELRPYLDRLHPEKPPRYSRATMETLAIIAYRQPVTRGDIEDIRGVTVSTPIIKQLEDRGWIEAIGYREAPGRPALYATTRQFLDDLGLSSLDELPALEGLPQPSAFEPGQTPQGSLLPENGQVELALEPGASPAPASEDPVADATTEAITEAITEATSEAATAATTEATTEATPQPLHESALPPPSPPQAPGHGADAAAQPQGAADADADANAEPGAADHGHARTDAHAGDAAAADGPTAEGPAAEGPAAEGPAAAGPAGLAP